MAPPTVTIQQDFMDSATRQSQINDWEYRNKLDQLFMLQLVFLVLMVLVILTVLWKYDILPMIYIGFLGVFLFGCIATLWFFRNAYTKNVRDKRTWDRRRFEGDGEKAPAVSPGEVEEEAKKRVAYYKANVKSTGSCPTSL